MSKKQDTDNHEVMQRVENSVHEFYEAMKIREEMSIRIGRRTTYITRFTMALIVLMGLVLFYLVATLSSQIKVMSEHMVVMTSHMDDMRKDIHTLPSINHHMVNMSGQMGDIRHEVEQVATTMRFIDKHVSVMPAMKNNIAGMDNEMSSINRKMNTINSQFANMNQSVGRMNYDVNRMAEPMSRIPFFSW